MIKITNVSKKYVIDNNTNEQVLNNINIDFNPGFNVILGPSGCGKSTLLNLISGLDSDYDGDIFINDKLLSQTNLDTYRRSKIGFIFQNFNLINHLSILENICVGLKLDSTLSKKQINDKALELLKQVGLQDYVNKLPSQLSGGQKQRVAIARSLSNNPQILFADEPTGALDSKTSVEVINILVELAKSGKTVIVVTHDNSICDYADYIVSLKDGKVENEQLINKTKVIQNDNPILNGIKFIDLLKFSFKNFKSRKFRNILVSLGSCIGIIGIIISLALGNGINKGVEQIFKSIISPTTITTTISDNKIQTGPPSVPFSETEITNATKILNDGNIEEVYTDYSYVEVNVFDKELQVKNSDQQNYTMFLQILNYNDERQNSYSVENETLINGQSLQDNKDGILISKDLAALLLKTDVDSLTLDNTSTLINKPLKLEVVVRTMSKVYTTNVDVNITGILKDATFANLAFASQSLIDRISEQIGQEPIAFSLTSYAKDSKQAQSFSNDNKNNQTFRFQTLGDVLDQISTFTTAITILIAFIAGLSLLVAAVMISIVLYISVVERTKEIGILRAIGYTSKNIKNMFLIEAVIIITISNIIAVIVTFSTQIIFNPIITKVSGFNDPIQISISSLTFIIILTLLISIIAGIYPAIRASKLDPISSLRYE